MTLPTSTMRQNSKYIFPLLLMMLLMIACSDLMLESDRKPASLEINPDRVTTIAGENFNFEVTVVDEDGQPYTATPAWTDTVYTTSNEGILTIEGNNVITTGAGTTTLGVKISGLFENINVRVTPRMYMTQSVQAYGRNVPMVAGRDGVIRLFLQDEESTLGQSDISIKLFRNGALTNTLNYPAGSISARELSDNVSSIILPVPGNIIQPGLSVLVTAGSITYPQNGTPLPISVQSVPDFHIRLVPIHVEVTGQTGNVTSGNIDEFLEELLDMMPISEYNADLHAPLTTNVSPEDQRTFYDDVLNQVEALRVAEGSPDYYYYGVIPQRRGGIVGLGNVPGRAAVGWDRLPNASETLAHELGHNFNRPHAPCGGAGGANLQFPYQNASIGVYGFEVDEGRLKSPFVFKDLMSYCSPTWISDYTYTKVMDYRAAINNKQFAGQSQQPQEVLLVWGSMNNSKLSLQPAFKITTRPKLPEQPGLYTLSGYDANGTQLFSISFSGNKISHSTNGARNFAFAIPVNRVHVKQLAVLRLSGKGQKALQKTTVSTKLPKPTPQALPSITARRKSAMSVSLQWSSSRYQMTLVKNPRTGEVLSFTRGGVSEIYTDASELKLYFSDGVHTAVKQVSVQ